jgi:energy-coupling factor transporter ATP-binding protein EcfA2
LLYGENGSGKTSLYRALNDFIQSFYCHVDYTQNRYKKAGAVGEVMLSIGDYDETTREFTDVKDYRFGEGVDNTGGENTGFMKALAQTKGFLNYRDLLKMYLYEEDNPNLFKFFVEHLLGSHVPVAQGRRESILTEWEEVQDDVFNVYNRSELKHVRGLRELVGFETMLRSVLDGLFNEVNKYLDVYFDNFGLQIDYELKPMKFSYGRWRGKANWSIQQDLRLKISLCHSNVSSYIEGLNEARLSAIAICLYLSALKANPGKELHLMFLDDIFIGIDSSNRWPILEILVNEFKGFQIIMATYDRSWYCLARNYLSNHRKDSWKFVNLYSLPKKENGQMFFAPVLTAGKTAYDRAKEYLHGQRPVDLPAAANYFRKALEELISEKNLPKELFLSDDFSLIPGYKLTKRVGALADLFLKIGEDATHILTIESYLHPLIHPLSHFEEEAQVYRGELVAVEEAIVGLYSQIADMPQRCRLLMGRGNKVEIHYDSTDGSYTSKYQILMEDNMWLYKDCAGAAHLTDCKCRCVHMEGTLNGEALVECSPHEKMKIFKYFCYSSLDDALQKIYDHEVNKNHHAVVVHTDYDIVFKICNRFVLEPFTQKRDELLAAM